MSRDMVTVCLRLFTLRVKCPEIWSLSVSSVVHFEGEVSRDMVTVCVFGCSL